jgi:tRNA-dihydrouridine synthase B
MKSSLSPSCSSEQKRLLPWQSGVSPLMLAPMQGVTNRAMRALFIDWAKPDVVFTEFVRVNAAAPVRRISNGDLKEMAAAENGVPLVVQLIGHGAEALIAAAHAAQGAGAVHLNLNMGCPYGRMTSGATGGGMLKHPEILHQIIPPLRRAVSGSFSVKIRAGYDDPEQILRLLPLFEQAQVDFLVLHPRTVVQRYEGFADHRITARVVKETPIPVIANGDIRTAAEGLRILEETGGAGLMLGRGAIADPLLFGRLRDKDPAEPEQDAVVSMLQRYLDDLLSRYGKLFCGEQQVLAKTKEVLAFIPDPNLQEGIKRLRKAKSVESFRGALEKL